MGSPVRRFLSNYFDLLFIKLTGSNCLLARAMDGRITWCGIIGSCQSSATSETVKCCWSQAWVINSTVTRVQTFTLHFSFFLSFSGNPHILLIILISVLSNSASLGRLSTNVRFFCPVQKFFSYPRMYLTNFYICYIASPKCLLTIVKIIHCFLRDIYSNGPDLKNTMHKCWNF